MEAKQLALPQVAEGSWAYYPQIKELFELRFGEGYMDEEEFAQWMKHPELVQVALVDGDFAGSAIMLPAEAAEIAAKMKMTEREVLEITGGQPAAIYKSIALWPKYEKLGIGRGLVVDGVERAEAKGYSAIFIAAWMYNGITPAKKMLHSLGFTELYQRKMLWYDAEKYRCVVCGGRCVCDGMIYYKKLGV